MISQKNIQMMIHLCTLAENGQYIKIDDLASRFQVSSRTTRYDLDKIDDYLKRMKLPTLTRDKSRGILLDFSAGELERLRYNIQISNTDSYVLSKQERVLLIELFLYDAEAPVKYNELAEHLSVSRKTVIEDVRAIKDSLKNWDVAIQSTKYGIRLLASEINQRQMLMDNLLTMFTPMELWKIMRGVFPNRSAMIEQKWSEIIGSDYISVSETILHDLEKKNKLVLSDDLYYLTIILTVFAVRRNALGHGLQGSRRGELESEAMLKEYCTLLREHLGSALKDDEYGYIDAEASRILNLKESKLAQRKADIVAEQLLICVSEAMGRKYYLDAGLRASLREHLTTILRNKTVHSSTDEMTVSAVLKENGTLFESVSACLAEMRELAEYSRDGTECALISLHFLAADERRHMTGDSHCKALVVCASGIGTAKMISAKIAKHFSQVEIVNTTSTHNLDAMVDMHRPDLILTVLPLESKQVPVIQVNALLTDDDLEKIRAFLDKNGKPYTQQDNAFLYERVLNTICRNCTVNDRNGLEEELRRLLRIERKAVLHISDLITADMVTLGLKADTWEEAVRGSARPLVEMDCVEPRYVDAMVDIIRQAGPYVVLVPGIAMPHALPSDGVKRTCMSLTTLERPVEFGNAANDPVKLVICIGAIEGEDHMREMSELIGLSGDRRIIEKICNARDKESVVELIRSATLF